MHGSILTQRTFLMAPYLTQQAFLIMSFDLPNIHVFGPYRHTGMQLINASEKKILPQLTPE
jgi:hypothetical protein